MTRLLILSFVVLLFSCKDKATKKSKDKNDVNTEIEVIEKDGFGLKVYDYDLFRKNYAPSENLYIINFWATWCKPCVEELPFFEKLNKEYSDKGVKVVLASLDFRKHLERDFFPFVKKHNLKSEVILFDDPDENRWINEISPDWGGGIPATLIFNAKDEKFYEGSFTYESLVKEVNSFLIN